SGSFLVAAVLEGRNFIGIEKNEDVALFKKEPINYITVCEERIHDAWNHTPIEARSTLQLLGLLGDTEE
ncbi:hypothetical protein, partial [Massilicoli timonensis]|uniref:hypothetical protein n=1 Tax=Massilicoli timonensis TaxID=2015901 RepID=UPI003AB0A9F2